MKLTEVREGQEIVLRVSNEKNSMKFKAVIVRHVKEIYTIINLPEVKGRKLIFDRVRVDVECPSGTDIPIVWNNVRIANYNDDYVLQVVSAGSKSNRRNAFRVAVAKSGRIYMDDKSTMTIIKDVSLSGFAVTDRTKSLRLAMGNTVSISFEDLGYKFDISGRVNRIEEREKITIYGFKINSLCRDLPEYIVAKQKYNNRNQRK